jgi:toxin ParE1/3/4
MYNVLVENRAVDDIQDGIDYYDDQLVGLGNKFENAVDKEFAALKKNPFYQIRYNDIRCKPVMKFPYLIHFQVNEAKKNVNIFAVINTQKDPDTNWLKSTYRDATPNK